MMDGRMVGWLAGHKARNPPGFSTAYFLPFRCMHFNFMFTTQNYTGRRARMDFQLQTMYRVRFAFVSLMFSIPFSEPLVNLFLTHFSHKGNYL
jgi:hypothetical protein